MKAQHHTPGPWSQGRLLVTSLTKQWPPETKAKVDFEERRRVFSDFSSVDEGRGRRLIAVCESEEDAVIIAAAPDLLDALRTMLVACTDDGEEKFPGHYAAYLESVAKPRARAAIAKATGEAV